MMFMQTTLPRNRTLGFVTFAVLGLVAIADFLFYEHHLGWTAGVFALAILLAMSTRAGRGGALPWVGVAYGVVGMIGVTMFLEPGPLKVSMAALGLIVIAVGTQAPAKTPWEWARRVNRFLVVGWSWVFEDCGRVRRAIERRGLGVDRLGVLRPWILPVSFSLVFIILFAIANPIIERWLESFGEWASHFTELLSPMRIVYWGFFGVWLWALMRPRVAFRRGIALNSLAPALRGEHIDRLLPASTIVRCLILFNIVFGVQTLLDMTYLAGGVDLPEGMTYKEYARRGAYPLVATALLAGLFVILAFRSRRNSKEAPEGAKDEMANARRLVYVFLGQNILLLTSAIWRLGLYVDAYQMTRLRVAAAIWMGLVLVGFIWIIVRIVHNRSNTWLIAMNGATTALVLMGCCFVNFDGLIANYNVQAYTRGDKERHWIDIQYLEHLGPASLPALYELKAYRPDLEDAKDAEYVRWTGLQTDDVIGRLADKLQSQTHDWRGWTWRRAQLVGVVEANEEERSLALIKENDR